MKKSTLIAFILILFSNSSFSATYIKTCNNCSINSVKQKAQSAPVKRNSSTDVYVFDEHNLKSYKYVLYERLIDDNIPITDSFKSDVPRDVHTAFLNYVKAKNKAETFYKNSTLLLDKSGRVSKKLNVSAKRSRSSFASNNQCVAKEVPENYKTAHNYVNNSRERRVLFHNLRREISADPYGHIAVAMVKYTQFTSVMESSSNSFVSMAGSTLNILSPNNFRLQTADGGFMKGYMDFDKETFVVTTATDGDCNDIPLSKPKSSTRTEHSNSGSANRMLKVFEGYGGKPDVPVCNNYGHTCTRVRGQTGWHCNYVCFQWQ
ncbi:hypothetical protein [Pseudoalteromonas luteoviolacea]|uniref:Uncharacterized protein n=1 Tax=Pseudoalteromonas luteoviolacea S4054 TaxID=1129367 RepID=A0A0F6AB44_9GAMM|nr:hypothetical protein [Pseudoalteromonas luteoviolacea]AOT07044.1 hypothetical protein S4054249_03785 [Pseudoalteromonas luteoviolacea]AOT11962.1 hypothetical protein S40542_03785 [Pseudoalteromonas luteoviolacea]AOT16874.1 hypothetical protein S4054_03785 [Pseudoalteromonas luteoviolacea]KKE82629.1 hypothetical protein N479_17615 [Pseudoalteromonas luteoviolacea S4054]KZN69937.1 hypothetical protein N481_21210 [Pseudoalteromonas luteoviolacea S4047-1]